MASPPADEIALHTSALQTCRDTSSACHHLLSRSAAFLQLHASSPSPSLAARAVRDAAAATQLSPRLPASWLALFSAHVAAGSPAAAASALNSGLRFCPHDHALRFARASLDNSHTPLFSTPPKPPSTPSQPSPYVQTPPASTPSVQDPLLPTIPVQTVPVQTIPVQTVPVQTVPVQTVPAHTPPVQTPSVHTPPAQRRPVQTRAVQTRAVQTRAVQTRPVQSRPVQSSPPAQTVPVQTTSVQTTSAQTTSARTTSVQTTSAQTTSEQTTSAQTSPVHTKTSRTAFGPIPTPTTPDPLPASRSAPIASVGGLESLPQLGPDDLDDDEPAESPILRRDDVPYTRSQSARPASPSPSPRVEILPRGDNSPAALLRTAEARLGAGAFDEAIVSYTRLLQLHAENPSSYYIQALAGRSDAYLQKARAADDATSFVRAAADARRLVSLRPTWDDAWLRLGAAHLENGCPARARLTFKQGIQACPASARLKEGLRDAQYVIDSEGAETDWEDADGDDIGSESSDDGFEDPQIATPDTAQQWGLPSRSPEVVPKSLDWSKMGLGGDKPRKRNSFGEDRRLRGRERSSNRRVRSTMDPRMRNYETFENFLREREAREREELERQTRAAEEREAMENEARKERARDQYSEHAEAASSSMGMGSQKLYDLLQVPRDATSAHIKKSYYNLARKYHPDKNKDDVEATDRFQKLAEAYRVLSDPESRAVYDKYGDKGLVKNSVEVIDPSTLFAMVFGSDQFVNIIGELQLASLANNVDENGTAPSTSVLDSIQRARVGKLVLEMVKTLKPWVDGDKKGFLSDLHRQMRRLRQASFGPSLLHTVGNVYLQQTSYLLDKTRPFNLSAVMRKASLRSHRISSQHKAMSAAGRVMDKQRRLHDRVMRAGRDSRSISDEEATRIAVEMAQNAIDMMWKISVIDIESTLEDVVAIVLSGRDLIAAENLSTSNERPREPPVEIEKSRRRLRIGSHLGMDRRDQHDRVRDNSERHELGLVRPGPALAHGEPAVSRQQILSERAYGIQAMGRIFMSAFK